MTTAQITAVARAIEELLGLEREGLQLTTTPITTEIGWKTIDITLHAVRAKTSNDLRVRVELDELGRRAGVWIDTWEDATDDKTGYRRVSATAPLRTTLQAFTSSISG